MNNPVNDLRRIKTTAKMLSNYINEVVNALIDVDDALDIIKRRVGTMPISDECREKLTSLLSEWERQWFAMLRDCVKKTITEELNKILNELTKR